MYLFYLFWAKMLSFYGKPSIEGVLCAVCCVLCAVCTVLRDVYRMHRAVCCVLLCYISLLNYSLWQTDF